MTHDDLWELVGLADVTGWPDLTPRELWIIARAKTRQKLEIEWGQTSTILAMIHNALAKHPKPPADFNPMARDGRRRRGATGTPVSFGELKAAILKDRERGKTKRRPGGDGSKKRR